MTRDEARRRQALARWHRRLAVVAGLWLLMLALTGVLINHANDWGLDRSPLPAAIQRLAYGIEPGGEYCDLKELIGQGCREVFARIGLPAGALMLSPSRVFLLGPQEQLVEAPGVAQFGLAQLEAGLVDGARVYLRGPRNTILTDAELLEWRVLDIESAAALAAADWQVRPVGSAPELTWERLLLDLHAARFLGSAASLANDLLAGVIVVLAVTGGWLYLARRRRE